MNQLARARKTISDLQNVMEASPALTTDMQEFTDHFFAPGIYLRTLFIPKGHVVVGKIHKQDTLNILLKGKISVVTSNGEEMLAEAPFIFVAKPGQKTGYAITDVWYASIHPNKNDIMNIEQLEAQFTVPTHDALEVLP